MNPYRIYLRRHILAILLITLAAGLMSFLLINRLGSLVGGLSRDELGVATTPIGWHGLYHNPFDLPLLVVRSIVFYLDPSYGKTLARLPNVLFGGLTILAFACLVRLWHGTRIAIFAAVLFTSSAWVLHTNRLASPDVLYLGLVPTLLLSYATMQRYGRHATVFYGNMLLWGMLLYIPGAIWLVIASVWFQRKLIARCWAYFRAWWQRGLYVLAGLLWLPLLTLHLTRPDALQTWLGLPNHLASPALLLKHFAGVFVHLFVRGPEYPQIWLGRAPVLDIFVLAMSLLGIYFYITHRQAARSRMLALYFAIGALLVTLGGAVGLSVLVPIIYLLAATGMAYLLRDWLKVFPVNPLARNFGIGLLSIAVALSCLYNLRAYFVAWPNNSVTKATFRYQIKH